MRISLRSLSNCFLGLLLFWGCSVLCFADVVLHGDQVIDKPTTYDNQILDLTDGRFTIKTGGSLRISNSTIKTQISQSNPYFVKMMNGNLDLKSNTVKVSAQGLSQNPDVKTFDFDLIQVQQGKVSINQNSFTLDKPYTIGFLSTQNVVTSGLTINDNTIDQFHGGLYLYQVNHAEASRNKFTRVSFSNIFSNGGMNKFDGNVFVFPGNLHLGNAFDIFNASDITVSNNIISSGSNFGITITGGKNVFISNNKITDGRDFAISINTPSLAAITKNKYFVQLLPKQKIKQFDNNNIIISYNYFEQNKYGLIAGVVDNLIVFNNIFIQRFTDPTSRQYWTNNDNLLPSVTNLSWSNNEYKEAFTQDNEGDNSLALKFVVFPKRGGVVL